ncbi:MAG: hypothetical protein QW507_01015 [Candidatus Nanoarchaeia archaeon]|nr:hypothetical protein [Candidatus Haiyanarchaeum thermophilum]MCW1303394.1 hypothetical protein [Candidatus Haiyanarchaeum thermophilum]MCW1303918.1 hypothetical protein [Candidatus Haiyanarchaeum thermophilum]MCW1306756.1 hypothetical protein [Candidatus Haiyanarchaeum thermophilum]MCW1307421.1 hypothetical protein [Candidatus Haiyanarchaeum thermophilum]
MKLGFPGRFRPPTYTHIHLIQRLSRAYDVVVMLDDVNISRYNPFSTREVHRMLEREAEVEIVEIPLKNPREIISSLTDLIRENENFKIFTRDEATARFYRLLGFETLIAKREGVSACSVRETLYFSCDDPQRFRRCVESLIDHRYITEGVGEEIAREEIRERLLRLRGKLRLPNVQALTGIFEGILTHEN